jgi:autotransporter translocation and assembly factor TamB
MTGRRVARWIATVLLVCLALIAAGVVVATTPWFKNQVRELVVSRVGALIDGEIDVGALTGSLFGHVTLHDVVVRQAGEQTVRIGALTARYDILQIALGRFSIDGVEVRQPVLRFVEDRDGWNIRRLIQRRERRPDGAPWSVVIRRIELTGGHVVVEPLARRAESFADLNLQGALTYTPPSLDVTLDRLSVRDARTGVQVTHLAGELASNAQGFSVRDLVVTTPASAVRGHAAYRPGDEASLTAALDLAPLTLREFAAYLPPESPPTITVTGRVSAAGPIEAMAVAWDLDSEAGQTAGRMSMGFDRPSEIRLHGTAEVTRLNLSRVTGQPRLASNLTARTGIQGVLKTDAFAQSTVMFTLDAPHVDAFGYQARALRARGSLEDRTLRLAGDGQAYGARATFDATAAPVDDARARRISASGDVRGVNLEALPAAVRAPEIPTDINGSYAVDFNQGRWRAEMTTDETRVRNAVIASGTRLVAESQPGRFSAAVDGTVTGIDGTLIRLPDGRTASLGGMIHGRVTLPGLSRPIALEAIDAGVTASLGGSTVEGVVLETADVDVSLINGLLDVRQLEVRGSDLNVSAAGLMALAGEHQSNLTYTIAVDDLSRLAVVGVTNATGALHLEGTAQGPPGALAAAGTYGLHQFKYGTAVDALALNGTFTASVPDQDWARLTADVDVESAFMTLRGYDIQRLTLESHYQAGEIDLRGRIEQKARAIDLDTRIVAHPDHREIHLRQLTVAGPGSPWQLGGPGEAVINYGAETIRVEGLTFVRDQERVEASGLLAFAGAEPSNLQVRFQGVQVGDVYAMAAGVPIVTGVASGDVAVRGLLANPDVTGRIDVAGGQVAEVPYTRAGADVTFRDKRLSIDARIEEPTGSAFTVTGAVPLNAEAGALDVRVQSPAVSLGLLQAFTSHLGHVQGQANVDVHATGTLDAPSLTGRVGIQGGSFLVTATGVTYRDLNADIEFAGQRAVTRQFTVTDDDGHLLTMTAGADVFTSGKDRAFEVEIEARSLQVIENDLGDVEVDLQIRAEGGLAAPRLTGRIALDQGRLEVDEILRRVAPASRAPSELRPGLPQATTVAAEAAAAAAAADADEAAATAEAEKAAETGLFSRAAIDLDIVVPDALVLRGQDVRAGSGSMALGNLNLTIGGNLDLNKSPGARPTIQGSLGVVRGFYEFQGRRFDVTRGSAVSFRGPDPANPSLNVTGERNVQGVIARVQVTGTLRRPRLALSSDPSLDEGDVLSLIVFNQPINQLGEAEQVDLLDRAGALAMGTLATSLSESIGDALDIDLFEIRAPGSGEAGQVNFGRQVNDRLFVGFQQEFAGGEASRLSFEYQLTDALRILTSVAQGVERAKRSRDQDTAGIDLIYQIRY